MRLGRLRINDFMIFGQADIDLSDVGLASIVGEHVSDRRRSNGSGKSAFMESIRFALFDQTRGKSKHGVIREGCDSCSVDLSFEVDGSHLRVVRTRSLSGASKAKLWIDGRTAGDKVRVVNGVIADRIGVDAELFDLIYFFKQGDQFGFAEANPSDRKSILSKVFKMRQLAMCSDAAKDRLRECKDRSARLTGAIQATKQQISNSLTIKDLTDQSLHLSGELANLMQLKEARQHALVDLHESAGDAHAFQSYFSNISGSDANQKATVQIAIKDIEEAIQQKAKLLFQRTEKTRHAQDLHQTLLDANKKPEGDIEDAKILRAKAADSIRVFSAKLISSKAEATACRQKLQSLQLEGGNCPTCGQQVGSSHSREIIEKLSDDLASLDDLIADLERNIECCDVEIVESEQLITKFEQYAFSLRACENAWNSVQMCEDVANEAQEDLDKLKSDREVLLKELDRVSNNQVDGHAILAEQFVGTMASLTARVKDAEDILTERISELSSDSMKADFELATCKRSHQQLSDYGRQIRDCDRDLSICSALTEAFGKDGIQALIIENALGAIEKFANDMLDHMQTRFVIELKTQKQTKSGEDKESLDILIYDGSGMRPFESYSGGERTLINLAIRLALSKAISALHGVSMQSLFMDEVFGALDEVNREEVVKVLSFLSRSFSQVLVVSHTDQVKDVIDSGIVIRRYDGWSEVTKTDGRGKEPTSSSS